MLSEGSLFKEKSEEEKKGTACGEGIVSGGADMKVFLEASRNQRGVASEKRNSKVMTHGCLIFCIALLPQWLNFLKDSIGNLG